MKEKIKHFFKRTDHSCASNLTLVTVLLTVILLIGTFLPLFGVDYSLRINNDNSQTDTKIFNSTATVTEVSTFDFVSFKRIADYKLFGTPIGSIELLGVNIYDTLTSPVPYLNGLKTTNDILNSGVLDFLVSDEFAKFCNNYLGEFGKSLVDISDCLYGISNEGSDI